jgi:UPF0755 protein
MARLTRRILVFLIVSGSLFGGLFLWGQGKYLSPGPLAEDQVVIVPRGGSVKAIGALLAKTGVIENPLFFRLAARLVGADKSLRAGEYRFPAKINLAEAITLLKSGKTVIRSLTMAEGLTLFQVLEVVNAAQGMEGLAGPLPDEGGLLPNTYHYSYASPRRAMVKRMAAAMQDALAQLWPERAEGLPFKSPIEALILASIVEKETSLAEERPHIAGVFINRLNRKIRLQSDPTVVYGLDATGRLGRALSRADLAKESPYNTYKIAGLPPTPICNPGLAAIKAVLHPEETDDLYFVASGTGGHAFSRTLDEHNRNVANWRKIRKKKQTE